MPQIEDPSTNVKVVCRLRPMNEKEKGTSMTPVVSASSDRKEICVVRKVSGNARQARSTYNFDEVLGSFSTQAEVFTATLQPLIDEVLGGFEATVFAYGQTGTGKTYTMEGDVNSEDGRGLVPRAAAALLEKLNTRDYQEFTICASCLEIYNEELSDLLVPTENHRKLELLDTGRSVCCQGLLEVPVASIEEILNLIHAAQEKRRVAETRMNERSSRSHTMFTLKVRCRRSVSMGELENVGKLHLVDLAGSECAKKASSVVDDSFQTPSHLRQAKLAEEERERRSINQSLLTLGRVITALRKEDSRVPYRDSKLTRLLQSALGGRCKTVVVATVSPAMSSVDETISTLNYSMQASGIKNKPVASSMLKVLRDPSLANVTGLNGGNMAELDIKISFLQQELEEAQSALARSYNEHKELNDRLEVAESDLASKSAEVDKASAVISGMQDSLDLVTSELATKSAEMDQANKILHNMHSCLRQGDLYVKELQAEVKSNSQELEASACDTMTTMESSTAQVLRSFKMYQEQLSENIQTPLAAHVENIKSDVTVVQSHCGEAEVSVKHCSARAQEAVDTRQSLLAQLAHASSSHQTCLDEQVPALSTALETVGSTLTLHRDTTACNLQSMNATLHDMNERMPPAMTVCHQRLSEALKCADAHLTTSQKALSSRLDSVMGCLSETSKKEQEGNEAELLVASISATSKDLQAVLVAEVAKLVDIRNTVSQEVSDLQKLRTSEQAIVDLLAQQRNSLHNEVTELSSLLGVVKQDLSSACDELATVRDEQRNSRARVLQAVMATVSQELDNMGHELDSKTTGITDRLRTGIESTCRIANVAENACQDCCNLGEKATGMVGQWGEAVQAHCAAVHNTHDLSKQAEAAISHASKCAVEQHAHIQEKVTSWGATCRATVAAIDDTVVELNIAKSAEKDAQTQWEESRCQVEKYAKDWADEVCQVGNQIGVVTSKCSMVDEALADLSRGVSAKIELATSHSNSWAQKDADHAVALYEVTEFAVALNKQECEMEAQAAQELSTLKRGAADISGCTENIAEAASLLLTAVDKHIVAMPAESATSAALMNTASTAMDGFGKRVQEVLISAGNCAARLDSVLSDADVSMHAWTCANVATPCRTRS